MAAALTTAYYAAPQMPIDAKRLFQAGCDSLGLNSNIRLPLKPSRAYGSSLVLAREWEMTDLEKKLAEAIEYSYEPTWDTRLGEFTWGLGLNEDYPRGQFNAFLAAAEASGPGLWTALSEKPLEVCPQITEVDFPTMAFTRAEWVDGELHLRTSPNQPDPRAVTRFKVSGLMPGRWQIAGNESASVEVIGDEATVAMPLIHADLILSPLR